MNAQTLSSLALSLLLTVSAYALDPHVEAVTRIFTSAKGKVELTTDGQGVKLIDLNVPGTGPHDINDMITGSRGLNTKTSRHASNPPLLP